MASLIVRKLDATVVVLDDIGLSITGPASTTFDLLTEQPNDISMSADLVAAIGVTLEVLDPRDGTTLLSTADGILTIENHNLPHFGIQGGRFGGLDAPGASPSNDFIVEYDSGTDTYIQVDPAVVISSNQDAVSSIVGGMIEDGTDTTVTYNPSTTPILEGQDETNYDNTAPNGTFTGGDGAGGTAYAPADTITLSDGSVITVDAVDGNGDVTDFTVTTNGGNVTPGVTLTQSSTSGTGTLFDLTPETPNIQQGSVIVNVDDSYLRNDGDTLDSGTLSVASGATIAVATGGSLTIADAPTAGTDAANKDYVDSVASGLDPKESVRYATASDPGGTFAAGGGTGGTGEYTAIDLTASGPFDGLTGGAIAIGDRLLIKDAVPTSENGIYVVTTAGAAGVIERAADHDGSPANEVSGGNFTFVEEGTANQNTGWVLQWDGDIVLNTDPIIFVKFSESTNIAAGVGISQGGTDFDLDLNDTLGTTNAIVGGDLLGFHDLNGAAAGSGSGSQTYARTFTNMLADLDIVNGLPGNGFAVQTAADTYTNRSIAINGAGALDGLAISNGDGVAGNPTVGLDIQNLPVQTAIDPVDRIAVWDSTANANVYYTVNDVAGALSATNSFETWAGAGNTTGDATIVADSGTDTATLTGGIGINIDLTAASDTLTFSFSRAGMADTAVTGADTVPFFDATNSNEPEYRSWTDIISDLGLLSGISAATAEDLLGIDVTGSVIGFTIDTLTNPVEEMATTDEFAVHNKSEGTGGANRKITGQEIADGVETILGIGGITISTINGQPILTITDTTRTKQLSVESHPYQFGENSLVHLDWVRAAGNANDADSGYIMPLNGTVVFATAHCENTSGADSKDIHLFVNAVDNGSLGTLSGGANVSFTNTTVDVNFTAGDKIRLQAQGAGTGNIEDTVVAVTVRWRA